MDKLTIELFNRIMSEKKVVWSAKRGIVSSGFKVIVQSTERLFRGYNFTDYRLESYLVRYRSTLSDFEFDYYLSAEIDEYGIVYLDVARVFDTLQEATSYRADREGYIVKMITTK